MAEDRNALEQRAMLLLAKGKNEEALAAYLSVLKLAPRDLRIRQKIADLYLQMGKKPEALRQLREVAIGLIAEDQHRSATVVLKQLHGLKPKDDEATGLLGDCYKKTGFVQDAREWYEKTLELLDDDPGEALQWAAKLIEVAPGEMPPKIAYAGLLNRAGKFEVAFGHWQKLGREARRRGNASDQAIFNEKALRIDESAVDCLESAAEARISMGQPKEALVHIQKAYAANPGSDGVLSMLAQCFELLEQPDKAKKVLLQLAKLMSERNEPVERRNALERALKCDPEDAGLHSTVGAAVARAERAEMRLTDHDWSEPQTDDEAQVVVKAAVLLRYGFADRARDVLQSVDSALQATPSIQANLVEIYAALEDMDAAHGLIDAMKESINGGDASMAEMLSTRAAALRGDFEAAEDAADPASEVALEIEDADEVVEISTDDADAGGDESDEARGDRLAAAGDTDGAMSAYRSGLAADPTNTDLLMKIGDLISADEAVEPLDLPPEAVEPMDLTGGDEDDASDTGMPSFQNIFDTEPASASAPESAPKARPAVARTEDDTLSEARGRLLLGRPEDVAEVLNDRDDLGAAVLMAEAMLAQDDAPGAMRHLRDAMDESDEVDAAYPEALWVLSCLQARAGKQKAASKTLNKLERRDANHRTLEVAALRRGIVIST